MREEQLMIKIDARGDACPLPVVKAKKAIAELHGPGEVEVLVDNEIAVQNLTKMAQQKGYLSSSEKLAGRRETAGRSGNLHPGCPHRYSGGHRVRQDGGGGRGAG